MKHFSLLLFCSILLLACKKDKDPEPDNSNNGSSSKEFQVNSSHYSVQNALIRHSGYGGNSYLQKLTLLSSDFNFELVNDTVENILGSTGNGMLIMFYTSSDDVLTGTFTYSSSGAETPNTFEFATYGINYNIDTDTGTKKDVNQGTLTITDKGSSNYEVKLTGKDTDNNDFVLSYTGNLTPYRYDDELF